ncbi:AAA family ATPase [Roseibium litorale]|uniref:AAA family ATPase n=1 Tax=Roseibium litorale TaxID=2803841 RepID=A0ABR9CI74_9HYPH|nr:AAA family ATPase [Roseibium litorale]MBD8889977.1 AAA family ATPase [Roseibium litorale]
MLEDTYTAGNPALCGSNRLIVLSGCSGSGKSTLLAALSEAGCKVVPEAGRQIVREEEAIGGTGLPWVDPLRFVELAASRYAYHFNSLSPDTLPANGQPVIFDRSLVDVVSYLAYRGLETPAHLGRMLEIYRYCPVVLMTPPWPEIYEDDGERQKDLSEALREYEALMEAYRGLGYQPLLIPKATVPERAAFVMETLERLRQTETGSWRARPEPLS